MSELESIWNLFDELRENRNRWAHNQPQRDSEKPSNSGEESAVVSAIRGAIDNESWRVTNGEQYLAPRLLVDFVAKVGQRKKPTSIIDPVCNYGMLLAGAAEASGAEIIHGVELDASAAEIASIVLRERAGVVSHHGNGFVHENQFDPFQGMLEHYDLIVADAFLGNLHFTGEILIWAASRITEGGTALVVVPPAFFFGQRSDEVCTRLQKSGCQIGAAIHIPEGTRLNTNIGSYLLVLESGEQEDIFVGQLTSDSTHQDQLLANLLRRKPKGGPSLGRLCPLAEFMGYEAFVARENLSRLARDSGLTEHPFKEVFPQHERVSESGETKELKEGPDSLFLKLVGKGRASTRVDALRTGESQKVREVLHLKTDLEIADPSFLTHWFNESRVGRLALSSLRSGTTIPRIRPVDLLRSVISLPPLTEQKLVVEGAAYLGKIRAEIEELESALWSGTEPAEDLLERVQSINQEDHYEDWLEALPFPLASILWRHHASKDSYRQRYEMLIHFFEATAAFVATIHLSAMMKDETLWEKHGKRLTEKLSAQKLSLDRASFGSWKLAAELLGSASRALTQNKNEEEGVNLWQRLYGTTDLKIMEMITDSELLNVLQQANKIRNDWQGHGGAVSEDTAKSIHDQLMALVDRLRGLFGRNWQRYELIQPDGGPYRQGIHHISCKRLMGTRSAPFEELDYESREPLEAGSLYLFDSLLQRGLELRPFIKVIPSPERQAVACFIFNRTEEASARWVSYHFEQESEITLHSEGLDEALAMLHAVKEADA